MIVGKGTRRARRRRARCATFPSRSSTTRSSSPTEVAAQLDDATVLVLPSWPEGLGRVVIEAFARGRGVVATGAGGILDLVTDGVEGILIPPADDGRARRRRSCACSRDRELAARLGAAAHERYADWHSTPERVRAAACASSST